MSIIDQPKSFAEIFGHQAHKLILSNMLDSGEFPGAVMFTGTTGIGKTSLVRILAAGLNCAKGPTSNPCGKCECCLSAFEGKSPGIFEINGSDKNGIDDARTVIRQISGSSFTRLRTEVVYYDEMQMVTPEAQNALLKVFEQPRKDVRFIIATTNPKNILETIRGRCRPFHLKTPSNSALQAYITALAKTEKVQLSKPVIAQIIHYSNGSVREARQNLDSVSKLGPSASINQVREVLEDLL